jgi:hypothetical protein
VKLVNTHTVKGKMLPYDRIAIKEGGLKSPTVVKAAITRCYKCMLMGRGYAELDWWTERLTFRMVVKEHREDFQRIWSEKVKYQVKKDRISVGRDTTIGDGASTGSGTVPEVLAAIEDKTLDSGMNETRKDTYAKCAK